MYCRHLRWPLSRPLRSMHLHTPDGVREAGDLQAQSGPYAADDAWSSDVAEPDVTRVEALRGTQMMVASVSH